MARYHSDGIDEASYEADADLSATCALYRFVSAASTINKVRAAIGASNPAVHGVLYTTGSAGQAVAVKSIGHVLLTGRAGTCNLNIGKFIVCASDGVAEPVATAAGSPVCGKWLGPNITSGSAYGEALLFGYTACHVAAS